MEGCKRLLQTVDRLALDGAVVVVFGFAPLCCSHVVPFPVSQNKWFSSYIKLLKVLVLKVQLKLLFHIRFRYAVVLRVVVSVLQSGKMKLLYGNIRSDVIRPSSSIMSRGSSPGAHPLRLSAARNWNGRPWSRAFEAMMWPLLGRGGGRGMLGSLASACQSLKIISWCRTMKRDPRNLGSNPELQTQKQVHSLLRHPEAGQRGWGRLCLLVESLNSGPTFPPAFSTVETGNGHLETKNKAARPA